MPAWTPEVDVDAATVRRLVGRFPVVAGAPVRRLSQGWDRSVWRVGDDWVFGFPRREVVVRGFRAEVAWLPRLAPLLTVPVPVPELVGEPAEGFPWPYWGARYLPGRESCDAGLDPAGRRALGLALADFLRRLHGPDVAAAVPRGALPADANARSDMSRRVPLARTQLADARAAGIWDPPPAAAAVLDAAERLPPLPDDPDSPPASGRLASSPPVVHGDLHFRHLLAVGAGAKTRLSGVLDWVDLGRADPSIDLQAFWSFVDPPDRSAFLAEYGPVTDAQLLRARAVALSVNAALASYGHAEGMPVVQAAAVEALNRTLVE